MRGGSRVTDGDGESGGKRLRPRLGGHVRAEKPIRFRSAILALATRERGGRAEPGTHTARSTRGGAITRGCRPAFVRPPGALARRVVVKGHYHGMNAYGAKAAQLHVRYIQRDGVGEKGEPGALYGRDGAVRDADFVQALPGEIRQFRFIIAPEDGGELNLPAFTRRLMAQVESDLGRKLLWAGTDHHNTDNPHTHVVIRGVDAVGRELRIDQEYIKNGFRNRARELATEELGLRSERQLEVQLTKEIGQQRFTGIDREISGRIRNGSLDLSDLHSERALRARLVGRVATLEALGFARAQGGPHWSFAPGWEAELRRIGEQSDIIKRIHQGVGGAPAQYVVFPAEGGPERQEIDGILRSKGLHDELRGTFYGVVEAANGQVFYVQLPAAHAEQRNVGDIVRVVSEPDLSRRRLDAAIAKLADQNNGRVTEQRIAGAGTELPEVKGGSETIRRRLAGLQRMGLATLLPDGAWALPPRVDELAAKRPGPQVPRRLTVKSISSMSLREQENHRGPTWLDGISLGHVKGTHGFGAAVAMATARRRRFLLDLGMDPDSHSSPGRLRSLERLGFGEELARRGEGRFVAKVPQGFCGHLATPREPLPSGQLVTVVRDAKSATFVVLARSATHSALAGKSVELSRDEAGRVVVHPSGRELGR